jgi:hypothetical protein
MRIEQLEQQIMQKELDKAEIEEKYKSLLSKFEGVNKEISTQKSALYKKAVEYDLEAIEKGSTTLLPASNNPTVSHYAPHKEVPETVYAGNKIASSYNLIGKAREARTEDTSTIQIGTDNIIKRDPNTLADGGQNPPVVGSVSSNYDPYGYNKENKIYSGDYDKYKPYYQASTYKFGQDYSITNKI